MHETKFDTQFFERYARISLIDLLGDKFLGLKNCDRPDLQDVENGLGIEVTRAIAENKQTAVALENEISGKPNYENANAENEKMVAKYGYSYGIYAGIIGNAEARYWNMALPMFRVIESKIQKVANDFYGDFSEFDLYVFSKETLAPADVVAIIDFATKLQRGHAKKYSTLFVSQIQEMFVCDLQTATFTTKKISVAQCKKYYAKATQSLA